MSWKKSINENSTGLSNDLKKCKTCKEYKETYNFYKDKYTKDWFTSSCIICRKEKWKKWYSENTEKARQIWRDWYYKSRERNIENSRNYKINNREKVSEYWKRYRKEYYKRWYVKLKSIASWRNRRKQYNTLSDWSITIQSLDLLLSEQLWKCNHCWILLEWLVSDNWCSWKHLDHIIPLSKWWTHVLSNVQWLCWKCNLKKWDRWIG